ncbi:tRNA pseudouridine(55) synthase TruB [Thermocrinis minervae]|uniref:tRNA pseudouridine synthase B n=1 Tax=Thermocrinis minervae TaxID=381751 RepID=A0A1M6Q471_9AQUI|nr:tRNA pseudouridine(55) synthase TruB [Thermocrinis minervae]SHK15015.1 tRNA pseudouridine55 synthase [Thermocrinis minervae]
MSSGVLLVDKPKWLTSTDVLNAIKDRFALKVGHTGTLDPIATGLLLVLVGEATKFSQFFHILPKGYLATAVLGKITDTYDADGKIVEERPVKVSCDDVKKAVDKFVGKLEQIPPPYSAKKVGGVRAYRLAREGKTPSLKPSQVEVYRAELLECKLPYLKILYEVSSGTYIRSLVYDLGMFLSCGAYLEDLRRLWIGNFKVEDAISLEELLRLEDISKILIPIDQALYFMQEVKLSVKEGERIKKGGKLRVSPGNTRAFVRLYQGNEFIGVGLLEGEELRPYRLLSA